MSRTPAVDRVLARIVVSDVPFNGEPCWIYTGTTDPRGYGRVGVRHHGRVYRSRLAHRVLYQALIGPIEGGLVLDHLCRQHSCVNPAHLDPVTQAENLRRGLGQANAFCKWGHLYDEANTYLTPKGERVCRACARLRDAARRATPEHKAYVSAYSRAYKARRGAAA